MRDEAQWARERRKRNIALALTLVEWQYFFS